MENPAALLKKVPKAGWYVIAGGTIGGTVLLVRKKQEGEATPIAAAAATDESLGGGSYGLPTGQSPGVIVPPVIFPPGDDNSAAGYAAGLEIIDTGLGFILSGATGLLDNVTNLFQTTQQQNHGITESLLAMSNQTQQTQAEQIAVLSAAGPSPAQLPPPPVVVAAPAPAAPAPARPNPPPAPAYRIVYENRTRDNGKSGRDRRVWCNRVKIHRYPDGRAVVVSETKLHDGAC